MHRAIHNPVNFGPRRTVYQPQAALDAEPGLHQAKNLLGCEIRIIHT